MEWLITLVAGIGFAVLLAPVAMLLLTFFVLVPLAHLMSRPAMIGRATFDCPVTRRRVNAAFVSEPGHDHPSDVSACSRFGDGPVTCKKGCLAVATIGWGASAMTPRYALISGDVALRDVARRNGALSTVA